MDMNREEAGFREVDHTADVEIEVWGKDKTSLFEKAAQGMYHLSHIREKEQSSETVSHSFLLSEGDLESLLVAFLSELLFYLETEQLMFRRFDLEFEEDHSLRVQLQGTQIAGMDRDIKAVTFHNLRIKQQNTGWVVNVVFDV